MSIKTDKKTETPPLLYPPMVEAIFELRWEMEQNQQTGTLRDVAYPMMYGQLYELMKKEFPAVEDLSSIHTHPEMAPFTPRHRMRKEANGYPLIQVGPGILTMNHAKGYSWSAFQALTLRLVEAVSILYPRKSRPLVFLKCEVRYVNALFFDIAKENPLAFLQDKLHIGIHLDEEIFAKNSLSQIPNAVGLNLIYPLQKPLGHLGISVNLGQADQKPAYVLQTLIQSFGETVPLDAKAFSPWLDQAHDVAENCFQSFCKGALMNRFCGA
ncbi:MAG: hypothetical protein A3E80_04595 [Chlamydiae bacterium RIFCSPHIGHO2_12_FULL_49_9]|nr:MAG: hypothetical protein A3E80_04595 [Chlamydiae bacterium RIFCSPHIGHO2_12_FULL_49_9]